MLELVIVLAAIAPAFFVLRIFIRWDVFPEPTRVILVTFLWGMASIVPVLLAGMLFYEHLEAIADPFWRALAIAFLGAAIPEELAKFAVLYFCCMRHSHFDEPMDGLVYGMTASLGFAALENIFYLLGAGDGWAELALLRGLLSVPSHGLDGIIMGFFAGLARFEPDRAARWWFMALAAPIAMHGLYDAPLFLADIWQPVDEEDPVALLLLLPLLIVGIQLLWALRLFRRLNRDQQALLAQSRSSAGR